jgi:hypothetical protein
MKMEGENKLVRSLMKPVAGVRSRAAIIGCAAGRGLAAICRMVPFKLLASVAVRLEVGNDRSGDIH